MWASRPWSCLALLYTALAITPSTNAQNSTEILSNVEQAIGAFTTLKADLKQESTDARLGSNSTKTGKLFIDRVNKMFLGASIIKYSEGPVVWVTEYEVKVFSPRAHTAKLLIGPREDSFDPKLFFFGNQYRLPPYQIRNDYNAISLRDEQSNTTSTVVLELTPKQSSETELIKRWLQRESSIEKIRVWVDKKSWLQIRTEVIERSGDRTVFTLSNVRLGEEVKDEILMTPLLQQ